MRGDSTPSGSAAETKALRRMFGAFATGVSVVTVGGASPHGMTANSFTSVSLDPPLALICVGHEAIMHRRLAIGFFGVSVLAADQEGVARHFADLTRPLGAAQFESIDCEPGPVTGVPLINGALATFEFELWNTYEGGDHSIFVGQLLSPERPPLEADGALLFYRGRFRRLEPLHSEVRA
ncbi:flavin reductase family protein [Actinomadura alba]|uniref:Flavin reductase n=1 Tax=Actinomadura alba TaxID=406431 RepID=A0ABR7LRZ5_9ACTN|nr:flavin reductase family protein [Actinomadura alba]MBC6467520.1 flavin reductase [Actinomadura alba]